LSEDRKSTFLEKLLEAITKRAIGTLFEPLDQYLRTLVRNLALIVGGVIVASIGVIVVAIGFIKWLSKIIPGWFSWILVGLVLVLVGILLVALKR
jgi:hypothetical protein